jgi:hypothetical protein
MAQNPNLKGGPKNGARSMGYRYLITIAFCCILFVGCRQDKGLSEYEELVAGLQIENPKHGFVSTKAASKWEESMISGNGTIGLLVPGAVNKDRIVLSHERLFLPKTIPVSPPELGSRMEETRSFLLNEEYDRAADILDEASAKVGIEDLVWTNPHIPACQIEFESLYPIEPDSYARSVDYETGEAKVAFKNEDILIHRDAFVSRSDSVAVIRFSSPNQSKLNYIFRLNQLPLTIDDHEEIDDDTDFRPENFVSNTDISAGENYMAYTTTFNKQWEGSLKSYTVAVRLINSGGTVAADGRQVTIENADEIMLLATIKMSYDNVPYPYRDLLQDIDLLGKDYEALKQRHASVHAEIYNRFSFKLGSNDSQLKTTSEELISSSSFDDINPALIVQLLKACRYNSISSTGELPPTLQGIWGGTWFPAWSGDFTLNGNVPSAIAAGLNTNHLEIIEAYLDMMTDWMEDFKYNARELFGIDGIFVPSRASDMGNWYTYNTDYPMLYWWAGAPWASHYFYDYWLYTGDEKFLKDKALPFMTGTYTFMKDILYEHDDEYIFLPSYSPEIAPLDKHPIAINATMDVAVLKQLLRNLIQLAHEGYIDESRSDEFKEVLDKLPEYAIDANGELKEWIWEGFENDNEHRHASHLYPLFDGVDPEFIERPTLKEAAKKAIESRLAYRRDGNGAEMAFGLAQLGMAAAHLKDVDHAYECVKWLSSSYWTPAFVSYHDPGQIFNLDISAGMPAVLIYMLIQSTADEIELLPALPAEWPDGEIKGALVRGGFEVDMIWKDSKPVEVTVTSLSGNESNLKFRNKVVPIELMEDETKSFPIDNN